MITRRNFLEGACAGMAATTFSPLVPALAANAAPLRLVAQAGEALLLEPGEPKTPIWGYNGVVPGPVIRVPQGEPFAADLINSINQPTTIHWHGIRIDNAMDGAAHLTQAPVKPGEEFAYRFTPPDAGTYWYHPHFRTWEQLARGLHGAFIVEEPEAPQVDQDIVMVFDDWRLAEDGKIDEASFDSMHDISHAGRLGNILTLNGQHAADFAVKAGQRLRLRILNAANARVIRVSFDGHKPVVIALDGQPVETPFAPDRNGVLLTPAQRADLILDCTGEPGDTTNISVNVGRETLIAGRLVYDANNPERSSTLGGVKALPPNPMPTKIDPDNAVPLNLVMSGGARKPFETAEYKGKQMGIRELVREHKKAWAFNGIVGMPDKPLAVIPRGKTAIVRMINDTAWPHAMHFHGHHVREISHSTRDHEPHWRDTIFMRPDETISVAFEAHNPGKWMLHCHMLGHQRGGMGTWYEVV